MTKENEKKMSKENKDVTQEETYYYAFYYDRYGKTQKVPCDENFYREYRNLLRSELHENAKNRRCLIESSRYSGLVMCRDDCSACPHLNERREIVHSLDHLYEEGFDVEDEDSIVDVRIYDVLNEINKLSINDKKIIQLFMNGNTDEAIAKLMNSEKERIKKRRQKLFAEIRKKLL